MRKESRVLGLRSERLLRGGWRRNRVGRGRLVMNEYLLAAEGGMFLVIVIADLEFHRLAHPLRVEHGGYVVKLFLHGMPLDWRRIHRLHRPVWGLGRLRHLEEGHGKKRETASDCA